MMHWMLSQPCIKTALEIRFPEIWGVTYDFSKSVYKTETGKILIICPLEGHGEFYRSTYDLDRLTKGCPKCGDRVRRTHKLIPWEEIEARFIAAHGNRYGYEQAKAVYTKVTAPVPILCSEHGVFRQSPVDHYGGHNCPRCARQSMWTTRRPEGTPRARFNRAVEIHGDKFDYTDTDFSQEKITVWCNKHGGTFETTVTSHIRSQCGCNVCAGKLPVTFDEFVKRSGEEHSGKYGYETALEHYVTLRSLVLIQCPIHGIFRQQAGSHMRGTGCPTCYNESRNHHLRTPWSEVLLQFEGAHGDRYGYDAAALAYVNIHTAIPILCREAGHGIFKQRPYLHIGGSGCPVCAPNFPLSPAVVRKRLELLHGNKFDYSCTDFGPEEGPLKRRLTVWCNGHSGFFETTVGSHLHAGAGCRICAGQETVTFEVFCQEATNRHKGRYDYEHLREAFAEIMGRRVRRKKGGLLSKITLICKEHGEFRQTIRAHMKNGAGCRKCVQEEFGKSRIVPWEDVLARFHEVHGNTFDYTETARHYVRFVDQIPITCREHGLFYQAGTTHANGGGCPICQQSQGERAVYRWLTEHDIKAEPEWLIPADEHVVSRRLQADFMLSDFRIIVEYDGQQHFEPDGRSGSAKEAIKKFEQIQRNDRRKNAWAAENDYGMIRVPWKASSSYGQALVRYVNKYLTEHLLPLLARQSSQGTFDGNLSSPRSKASSRFKVSRHVLG